MACSITFLAGMRSISTLFIRAGITTRTDQTKPRVRLAADIRVADPT
jgi:hypothetical protein